MLGRLVELSRGDVGCGGESGYNQCSQEGKKEEDLHDSLDWDQMVVNLR